MKVSGDLMLKLAIAAGAAWGVYVMFGKASDAISGIGKSISNTASAAMDSATGVASGVADAAEGGGFGSSGLSGMWINGPYQYDVSAFQENERAAAEAGIGAVKASVLPSPDNVAGMFVSAQLAIADWLQRIVAPVNKPYTGDVPNIEINSWR